MSTFSLWLSKADLVCLDETRFEHPLLESAQRAVRGKSAGAFHGYYPFQWTSAVQALSILMIRAKASFQHMMIGGQGSPAASLDYALSKEPSWLLDMFGVDAQGRALARRLFKRSNPERKRPGPVMLALNAQALPEAKINIYLNGQQVFENDVLCKLADAIEMGWRGRATGFATLQKAA